MKKVNKGNTGFVVGLILYILAGLILVISTLVSAVLASDSWGAQRDAYIMSAVVLFIVFIGVSFWFISFSTAFRQRKTQIELLESLVAQGISDSV